MTDKRITVAAVAVVLGITGLVAVAVHGQRSFTVVADDQRRIAAADRLLSAVKDVETAERGFVITGREDDLQYYDTGLVDAETQFGVLQRLGVDTAALHALVDAKLGIVRRVIAARQNGGPAPAAALEGDTLAMEHIRAAIADLRAHNRAHIARTEHASPNWTRLVLPLAGVLALGGFAGIVGIALQRRRLEHVSRTRLASVLDNAPVGLGFIGPDFRLRHMNRAFVEMGERALGTRVDDLLWDAMPGIEATLEPRIRKVIQSGTTVRDIEVEAESLTRPGQLRSFLFGFFPTETEGSRGAGLVVTDVTVRKRAERRLRDTEQRLRTIVSASAAILWNTGSDAAFSEPQPGWSRFTGQSTEQLLGTGWLDAIHPDDRAAAAREWSDGTATGEAFTTAHRLRRADGAWRDMAVQAAPVKEDDGTVREWVGAHTDVTDARRDQAELEAAKNAAEAANHAKSQFLANMSHELRTPLSAVIGYSEMLEEEIEELNQPGLLQDLRKINGNARHLLSLINDVLDLSKIEAERMTTFAEDIDLDTLLHDVVGTVGALVAAKNNTLVLDVEPDTDLGSIHTDQVKLRQCLFNLVGNAAKFTENGRITLSCRRGTDGFVTFAVSDTGIGMTEEQLGRLFQRFTQADDSTTRRFGGSGLGLAITRAFCQLLGGDITVDSIENQGSTFTVRIPARLSPAEEAPEPGTSAAPAAGNTVLVADDDAHQRSLLVRFLEREGFDVRTAADGRTALDLARSLQPRAILLDVVMPQLDGWAVLTALKADAATAAIPVVMITFVNEPALSNALGAAGLITKPIAWDRLKQVLDRLRGEDRTILIVDDDDDARARVRTVLERAGWSAIEAANGRDALSRFDERPQCLILLDLTMPVMDGFAFLSALRERPLGRDVPVVVLTARDLSAEDRRRLQGADRVLQKGQTSMRTLANEVMALTGGPAKTDG